MAFGTRPLGLALLCSATGHTPAVLIGLLIASLTEGALGAVSLCTYLAAGVLRFVIAGSLDSPEGRITLPKSILSKLRAARPQSDKPTRGERASGLRDFFDESLCLRICGSAICALIPALHRMIAGGFRYYDLFAAFALVLLTPAAVTVYSIALERRLPWRYPVLLAEGLLFLSVMYATAGRMIGSVPLTPIVGLVSVFLISALRSPAEGAVAGILCGLAESPIYIPGYLPAALISLFPKREGREERAVLVSCLGAAAWRAYVGGVSALPGALISALIPGVLVSLFFKIRARMKAQEETAESTAAEPDVHAVLRLERSRKREADERFRGISEAFSSLSEMFYNLSDRLRRPGTLDLRRLCDDSFDRFCATCANRNVCWGLEYSETMGAVGSLISDLHKKGSVGLESVPEAMRRRCGCSEEIVSDINRECARLTGRLLRSNRTEIFAMDYEGAADIIREALEEDGSEYRSDPELERRVAEYLKDAGVRAAGVTVYGNRRRRILVRGAEPEHAKVSSDTLHADLEELCGSKLTFPVLEVERGGHTMILQARQKLSVNAAHNSVSADGGVSGDSVNLFTSKRDCFYALISDGMGVGREAALTSGICSVFLEKMLRAGNRASTSLRMLNNLLRSRTEDSIHECSSTVDLLELDLMTGEASFMKSGASPSFVIRGKVVRRLQSGTVPIGIICDPDAGESRITLLPGDTVVMVSDGALQGERDSEWLVEYLEGAGEQTPEEIVYRICLHAADHDTHDDCSAVALRVRKIEN